MPDQLKSYHGLLNGILDSAALAAENEPSMWSFSMLFENVSKEYLRLMSYEVGWVSQIRAASLGGLQDVQNELLSAAICFCYHSRFVFACCFICAFEFSSDTI